MAVPMKATRPMRPTMAKNVVSVIMLPPIFFRFLNQVKAKCNEQQHDSQPSQAKRPLGPSEFAVSAVSTFHVLQSFASVLLFHGAKIQQNPQSSKTLVVKDAIQREHQKL